MNHRLMTKLRTPLPVILLVICFAAIDSGRTQTDSKPPAEDEATQLNQVLNRVRARIKKYHEALFNIAVTEVVRQQELRADATPKGKLKLLVYESVSLHRRSSEGLEEAAPIITRTLKSVDGKPSKQPSLPRRSKCVDTNPPPAYGDPLNFLVAENQDFTFAYVGPADFEGRKTAVVSITTPPAAAPVAIVEKDDCFRLSRGLQKKATIWIDLETFDVLQLQWQLVESFTGKMPAGVTRVGILPVFRPRREISYEKADSLVRFRPVTFQNPAQTLLLPISSEFTWILRGAGIAGYRTNTDYTRYRRFMTNVRVRDSDGK